MGLVSEYDKIIVEGKEGFSTFDIINKGAVNERPSTEEEIAMYEKWDISNFRIVFKPERYDGEKLGKDTIFHIFINGEDTGLYTNDYCFGRPNAHIFSFDIYSDVDGQEDFVIDDLGNWTSDADFIPSNEEYEHISRETMVNATVTCSGGKYQIIDPSSDDAELVIKIKEYIKDMKYIPNWWY